MSAGIVACVSFNQSPQHTHTHVAVFNKNTLWVYPEVMPEWSIKYTFGLQPVDRIQAETDAQLSLPAVYINYQDTPLE